MAKPTSEVHAEINKALYFARLQLDVLDEKPDEDGSRFTRQYQQCFLESAVIQLYRALCGLAMFSRVGEQGDFTLSAVALRKRLSSEESLLVSNILRAEMADIDAVIDAYEAGFQLGTSTNSNSSHSGASSNLLASDKGVTVALCRAWHADLSSAVQRIFEMTQEW